MAMLRVANCPSQDLALTNAAFVNEADAAFVPYAELGDLVLFTRPHPDVERGTVALNGVQRKLLRDASAKKNVKDLVKAHLTGQLEREGKKTLVINGTTDKPKILRTHKWDGVGDPKLAEFEVIESPTFAFDFLTQAPWTEAMDMLT